MSKYQAYPEYKDSGIEWLGNLPSHWRQTKIAWHFTAEKGRNGQLLTKEYCASNNGIYPVYSGQTENKGIMGTIDKYEFDTGEEGVLFSTTVGAKAMTLSHLKNKFSLSQNCMIIVKNSDQVLTRFAYYHFQPLFAYERSLIPEHMQASFRMEDLYRYPFAIPELEEQTQIATFLDHETAKIDTLIEKQQQLIELLKEKRQAVISHAVTKGLNPDVPMKDSGVEWLGQVPEHWVVRRLKHVATIQSGVAKGKDLTGKKHISIPMLRVANVQDGYLDLNDVHQIQIEPEQLNRYQLKNGDVLMNEGGDNDKLGRGAIWRSQVHNCIHQNHVFAIRPYSIEPEWLDIVTRADYAKFHFYRVAKQSTNLASISSTNIKETPLVIPPQSERISILSYLENQLEKFDSIEMSGLQQVKLLQERRTALISAAVTGKIDVRHFTLEDGVAPTTSIGTNEAQQEVTA